VIKIVREHPILSLIFVSLTATLVLYAPFIFHWQSFGGLAYGERFNFATVLLNFDSLHYITIAKTWYVPGAINSLFPEALEANYYPAHLPGYPALIWLVNRISGLDFPRASILVTLISSIAAVIAFYHLAKLNLKNNKKALRLAGVFIFFPARWLVMQNIPSPESLFIALVILAVYWFQKKKYGKSALMAILSQLVKSPGVLLVASMGLVIIIKAWQERMKLKIALKKFWPILLTPLGIMVTFAIYYWGTGDFWAYFKAGDNIHLFWPPFQAFDFKEIWVKSFWLEDVYLIYLLAGLGLAYLWKKYKFGLLTLFPTIFYLATCFIAHRDIGRYLMPAIPFMLLGAEKLLTDKRFLIIFGFLLPALYLYAINFISFNTMLMDNWAPYL
jgi:Gpi18-like mannosyltransferase